MHEGGELDIMLRVCRTQWRKSKKCSFADQGWIAARIAYCPTKGNLSKINDNDNNNNNNNNDTSVDPKQQYISRLSKTRMYKTAWQTKEETSARHSTSYTAMLGRVFC